MRHPWEYVGWDFILACTVRKRKYKILLTPMGWSPCSPCPHACIPGLSSKYSIVGEEQRNAARRRACVMMEDERREEAIC